MAGAFFFLPQPPNVAPGLRLMHPPQLPALASLDVWQLGQLHAPSSPASVVEPAEGLSAFFFPPANEKPPFFGGAKPPALGSAKPPVFAGGALKPPVVLGGALKPPNAGLPSPVAAAGGAVKPLVGVGAESVASVGNPWPEPFAAGELGAKKPPDFTCDESNDVKSQQR